jgi:hypothetical protein
MKEVFQESVVIAHFHISTDPSLVVVENTVKLGQLLFALAALPFAYLLIIVVETSSLGQALKKVLLLRLSYRGSSEARHLVLLFAVVIVDIQRWYVLAA